jgi:DNA-binding NarL/FixJ family response regulator
VLIAVEQGLLREGLCSLFAPYQEIILVAAVSDGQEAMQGGEESRPDVALVDVEMSLRDGIQAIRSIAAAWPAVRIVALGGAHDRPRALDYLRAGALAYVSKNSSPESLMTAVRCAARGEPVLESDLLAEVIYALQQMGQTPLAAFPTSLKAREIEILKLLASGADNRTIASAMSCAEQTVKNRLSKLYRKLGVRGRRDAIVLARDNGWIVGT